MAYVERDTDDFNRGTDTDIGSEWDVATGLDAVSPGVAATRLDLVSDQVRGIPGVTPAETFNAFSLPADQWVEVRIVSTDVGNTTEMGCLIRANSTGGTCYMGMARTNTGNIYRIAKQVNGTRTALVSATTPAFVGGELMVFEVITSAGPTYTLNLYMDGGLVLSTTDTVIASGSRGGLINSPNAGDETLCIMDNFREGDFDAGDVIGSQACL